MSFSIITRSFALWLVVGSLLWGYLGVLVANRYRLPILLGFIIGAITWFVGVFVLLIIGIGRRFESKSSTKPFGATPVQVAPAARPAQSWIGFDDPEDALAPSLLVVAPRSSSGRSSFSIVLAIIAATSGLLMFVSTFVSWGRWQIAWTGKSHLSGSAAPTAVLPAAIVVSASGLVTVVIGAEAWRRPRAIWLAVGAVIGAWWFTATLESLIVADEGHSLAHIASRADAGRLSANVSAGDGIWLMLVACIALLLWGILGAAALLAAERSAPIASSAPSAQNSSTWSTFRTESSSGFDD